MELGENVPWERSRGVSPMFIKRIQPQRAQRTQTAQSGEKRNELFVGLCVLCGRMGFGRENMGETPMLR